MKVAVLWVYTNSTWEKIRLSKLVKQWLRYFGAEKEQPQP